MGQHSLEVRGIYFSFNITFKFKGNQCRQFLKKLNKLEVALEEEGVEVATKGHPFIKTFKALDEVVNSCFGMELRPGYQGKIEEFKACYLDLGISVTPKV